MAQILDFKVYANETFDCTFKEDERQWSGTDAIEFHILSQTQNGVNTVVTKWNEKKSFQNADCKILCITWRWNRRCTNSQDCAIVTINSVMGFIAYNVTQLSFSGLETKMNVFIILELKHQTTW